MSHLRHYFTLCYVSVLMLYNTTLTLLHHVHVIMLRLLRVT